MNILIFGYGLHGGGFDSAMYFLSRGDSVRITDIRNRDSLGESVDYLEARGAAIHAGGYRTDDFIWADIVVKSPAIRLDNEFLAFAKRSENDLTYAASRPESKEVKIICVTGARNKTTTASALCHALNVMGKKARMCGNMGLSAFSETQRWDKGDVTEYMIIEMSTWQARDTYTFLRGNIPHVEVSVITSVFGEDLPKRQDVALRTGEFNLHANHIICPLEVKEGVSKLAAKRAKNVSSIESASKGISKALPEKMRAAYAVLKKLGFDSRQINAALKSFRGIPNRTELVLRTENSIFINDSSAIIPASVTFTMDNFENLPVHLICGGSDSSLDPLPLLKALKGSASVHLLDGTFTTKKLIPLLKKHRIAFRGPFEKIEEAVSSASSELDQTSRMMQVVLLCPGASGYEYFGNEFNRGDAFKAAVMSLA
ncbi:MAG: UDP-N-acetylmuramoylalanine--D-glutamate ligase [Spirochaetales bacterium]|nr:UDP-N-acetylmuramoylalanine--D-glutamate ligase [Spirochaetales bacterium]